MTKPVYEAIIQYGPIINGHEKMILICDTDDDIYQHYCESPTVKHNPNIKQYLRCPKVIRLIYLEQLVSTMTNPRELALTWSFGWY